MLGAKVTAPLVRRQHAHTQEAWSLRSGTKTLQTCQRLIAFDIMGNVSKTKKKKNPQYDCVLYIASSFHA